MLKLCCLLLTLGCLVSGKPHWLSNVSDKQLAALREVLREVRGHELEGQPGQGAADQPEAREEAGTARAAPQGRSQDTELTEEADTPEVASEVKRGKSEVERLIRVLELANEDREVGEEGATEANDVDKRGWGDFVSWMKSKWESAKDTGSKATKKVKDWGSKAVDKVKDAGSKFVDKIKGKKADDDIETRALRLEDLRHNLAVHEIEERSWGDFTSWMKSKWESAKDTGSKATKKVKDWGSKAVDKVKDVGSKFVDKIKGKKADDDIEKKAATLEQQRRSFADFKSWVEKNWESAKDTGSNAANKIKDFGGNIADKFKDDDSSSEEVKPSLEEDNRSLEDDKRSLEEDKRSLEKDKRSLEEEILDILLED